jgi:hypothetical protein
MATIAAITEASAMVTVYNSIFCLLDSLTV